MTVLAQPLSMDAAYADRKSSAGTVIPPPTMAIVMLTEALFCWQSYVYMGVLLAQLCWLGGGCEIFFTLLADTARTAKLCGADSALAHSSVADAQEGTNSSSLSPSCAGSAGLTGSLILAT